MALTLVELSKMFGLRPTKKPCHTSIPQNSSLPSPLLLAPRFPRFSALVSMSEKQPPAAAKRGGLFLGLLKDPHALLQDLLESPNKYEEGVSTLLQDLVAGRRRLDELTDQEMLLLDRATVDFAQPARHNRVIPPPHSPAPVAQRQEPVVEEAMPLIEGMQPYWWLG